MDDARHEDVVPPSREVMNRLRQKIQFCIPLTQSEIDRLYTYATGERITRSKRCEACEGRGTFRIVVPGMNQINKCRKCSGDGYIFEERS